MADAGFSAHTIRYAHIGENQLKKAVMQPQSNRQKPIGFITAMTYSERVTFIETPLFSKVVYDYLTEDEFAALQWTLVLRPEAGKIIPGSGGLRKIRWTTKGRGKRGGTRIVYYWKSAQEEIWLLTIYAKNEAENIPAHILKKIKEAMKI